MILNWIEIKDQRNEAYTQFAFVPCAFGHVKITDISSLPPYRHHCIKSHFNYLIKLLQIDIVTLVCVDHCLLNKNTKQEGRKSIIILKMKIHWFEQSNGGGEGDQEFTRMAHFV